MKYTFSFHIVHANTEGMSILEKWFRQAHSWDIDAENEEDARFRLAERIESEYPREKNYKAINVELVPARW